MPRRRQSLIEDLIDLASLLPPWLGLLFAVLSYATLHYFSIRELPAPRISENPAEGLSAHLYKSLAIGLQYILPFVFTVGAIISFAKRKKRHDLFSQTSARREASALLALSWREFELLISEFFRKQGYNVAETASNGPDGGIDLVLDKDGERFLVQCKHWRAQKVGVEIVRELYGLMAAHGATGGFVVTSGAFSSEAKKFSDGRNVQLLDGSSLQTLLPAAAGRQVPADVARPIPSCPVCAAGMVKRTARRGKDYGQQFWGCSAFPRCRGTRVIN